MAENDERNPDQERAARRRSIVALGVVILLFVVGWLLAREIYSNQKIEDCVMSGRTNCMPIDTHASSY
jgi:hypothetical protein